MKEEKMQHFRESQWSSRSRRPQTAKWKIPKADTRRESYSKSTQEHGYPFEIQSPITLSTPMSSLDNYSASEVIHLQSSNGTPRECYKPNNVPLFAHQIDGKLPHIHSSSDFHKTSTSVDGSSIYLHTNGYQSSQTFLTSIELKAPWYITILHEKFHFNFKRNVCPRRFCKKKETGNCQDRIRNSSAAFAKRLKERCLLKLGEEINRLSRYEVECKKKDQIICTLKNEIAQLHSDLHPADQGISTADYEKEDTPPNKDELLNTLKHHEKSLLEGYPVDTDLREDSYNSRSRDTDTDSERNPSASLLCPIHESELHKDSKLIQLDTQHSARKNSNEVQSGDLQDERHIQYQTDPYLDVLDVRENLIKLQEELDNLKNDHGLAKGTIISLQRMVSFQESRLRKTETEKEILQKHLNERVIQVQAMSAKFSSLREERKQEEMMADTEKDNYNLKELVSELKTELTKRNYVIGDLKNQVHRLQKEAIEYQTQVKKREDERSTIQSKYEDLECSEQHVKVALERLQSRFERFRSKIIQAAFSAPGVKVPQTEIPDHEALQAMQKIIAERSDFHQQLKQMGVKVSPLHSSENKQLSSVPRKNK